MTDPDPTTSGTQSPASYGATRDWPGYFAATAGRPPRDTLLEALDRFEKGPEADEPRSAVDLGCGEGRDTAELLRRGWRVHAIDGHPEGIERLLAREDLDRPDRLTTEVALFETSLTIPPCDLLNASFCLPFCAPDKFDGLWAKIVAAVRPGGRFAGQLFGERDTWASIPDRSHHTRAQAESLLGAFEVESFREEERDGETSNGTAKHWHVFHIVARAPEGTA